AAQVRAGRYPVALNTLRSAAELRAEDQRGEVARLAFQVLAHQALGHEDEARAVLDELDARALHALGPEEVALLAEARAAVGAEESAADGSGSGGSATSG